MLVPESYSSAPSKEVAGLIGATGHQDLAAGHGCSSSVRAYLSVGGNEIYVFLR